MMHLCRCAIVRSTYQGRTIIGTYSETRTRKDAADRQERIAKAEKLLKHPEVLKRKAQQYFLTNQTEDRYHLNEEQIANDARYDGFLAISTNANIHPEEALDHYRHLYRIEHTFRTFPKGLTDKSHLETRPMFHWNDQRIEGHICLCYIAYTVLDYVLAKLHQSEVSISERQLRATLDQMQVSLIKNNENYFYLRSADKAEINVLINKFGLKKLPTITPTRQIHSYL